MALDDTSDPGHFFRDQDLIQELRLTREPLALRAANRLAWLRAAEYMRVSNERGRLFSMLDKLNQ